MAASESANPVDLLCEQIAGASPDLLQAMIRTFAQAMMSAEADAVCGAGYALPAYAGVILPSVMASSSSAAAPRVRRGCPYRS